MIKTMSGKQSQKQSATYALKTYSKRVLPKPAEATHDLVGNKKREKNYKNLKNSEDNNRETITNEHDKEIPKENIYLRKKGRKLLIT